MDQLKINKIEKIKRTLSPYDFRSRLARLDPAALGETERFYLKNFGIYNHKLAPDRFALRIRVPAGRLSVEALEGLDREARERGSEMVVTTRGQLEMHHLSLTDAVTLSERIERLGLSSWQTYTDNFRNIVADPLEGLSEDTVLDVWPLIRKMQALFLKRPEWVGMLPRKFNVAIRGRVAQPVSFFGNDLYFALARKEDRPGFNLYAGGKNSETARDLDIFVTEEGVVPLFEAVATLYRDEGPRSSRSRARLFHMIEAMGTEAFREALLARAEAPVMSAGRLWVRKSREEEVTPLKGGGIAQRYGTRAGLLTEAMRREILGICHREGIAEVRLGCDRNLWIPGLKRPLTLAHAAKQTHVISCVGSRFCVYSLMDTHEEQRRMVLKRCRELGIGIGFSGCLKGCARHAFSDIGLVGIRTGLYADEVERGVRLYLGALPTRGEGCGRLILYAVPLRCIDRMLLLLCRLFEGSGEEDFEAFARRLNRYSEAAVAFWLLYHYDLSERFGIETLWQLDPRPPADEKGWMADRLVGSPHPEAAKLRALLQEAERFDFREAIVYLERAAFTRPPED